MDKIKEFIRKPIGLGLIGLVIGIVIGLVILGWGLWPVRWTDANPVDLQNDFQRDYLCMIIDSYIRNQDDELMQLRWEGLGELGEEQLSTLTPAACRFTSDAEIAAFKELVNFQMTIAEAESIEDSDVTSGDEEGAAFPTVEETPSEAQAISFLPLAILILATLVVGGILIYLIMKRSKAPKVKGKKTPKINFPKIKKKVKVEQDNKKQYVKESPIAQFMTTYRQGDDLYDDSFSIDTVRGEFLGECGVGIAETIGVGDPKKVTALEVWLFDKNDVQTVTKVLMSEHASNDSALLQRMQSKGEPILIEPGMRFLLETASLQLEAHVVDMVYARGPLPENSYFSRLTLEVSVWQR